MKTILLIDDDEDEFLIFSEVLNVLSLSLNCMYQSDPMQGLVWRQNNVADFVFVDMIMPKMTGIELIQQMRMLQKAPASKFVLLSTYISDTVFEQALAAGATTCIQKMDTVKSMAEKVNHFFSAYNL